MDKFDQGEFALVDLWESDLIASLVVIREDFIEEMLANLEEVWES